MDIDVTPINAKRIYQSVIEQFIDMIKTGKLQVGQKLPSERTLAEMFTVSRASIREAFRAMEIIGLIEVKPGGGSYVTDLNIANFFNTIAPLFIKNESMEDELLDFRKMLELEAVKIAATKASPENLLPLTEAIELMKKSIENDDLESGSEADIMFHKTIFKLTDNYILIKSSELIAYILESSVKFNRQKILKDTKNSNVLLEQHIKIFEAIKENNPDNAVKIMRTHLDYIKHVS
jgi:GntR family transcriptional repressor for pyruvate dehydrogenase complex